MASISVDSISKGYRMEDGSELSVISDVSFDVEDNEFFSVLGPSGCGKSTLLTMILGLVGHDEGTITVDGASHENEPDFGFVFQEPRLLKWKTVGQNLQFVLEAKGVPKAERTERIDHVLDMVGLSEFKDQYPQSLSGGMQQRVGLARALCIDPDILLMDEPFGSLDEITARKLRSDLLDIWREERKTIIFVTHDISEAAYLSDRIAILSDKPAHIAELIEVDIPRPRDQKDPELLEYEEAILNALHINF